MLVDPQRASELLRAFDFTTLFVEELGWDRCPSRSTPLEIEGSTYLLNVVAEKRGVQALVCQASGAAPIPPYRVRQLVDRQIRKLAYEHLLVFIDETRSMQVWQWVSKEPGRSIAYREHAYHTGQPGVSLVEKLEAIAFPLSDEEALTITGVTRQLRDAFDRDRVTKRFYDRFKVEQQAFLGLIEGIGELDDREWYASLMLNRLMFVYFIQRKGFLDGDLDYLRHRLELVRLREGTDEFFSFYRHFLLRLFHEGLGARDSTDELDSLLGKVPYLNGGLFDVHQLEELYPSIAIPDEAFERLFAFFDSYQWHLDERPIRSDNEINPDVLGYIFEKYINQRAMGAYYTREDITHYICERAVLPKILDVAADECAIAFDGGSHVWRLLASDPDRYIPRALKHGIGKSLPEAVEAGISDSSVRQGWEDPAEAGVGLPMESWRECVSRRARYERVRARLASGETSDFSELVDRNLDIAQFVQDAVETCEGSELLRAFYKALTEVTVLDLTCGSGAFLFAALNVLEPLYESCLDRMQSFVDDADSLASAEEDGARFPDFRTTLEEVATHPNRRYFILKSIVVRNLFGLDLMDEAVEICKLRLFLKLASQVPDVASVEPLPDVDFNIRAGNALVGFATLEDVEGAILGGTQSRMDVTGSMDQIAALAASAGQAFARFQKLQLDSAQEGESMQRAEKNELRRHLASLRDHLDRYLAWEYGVDPDNATRFAEWRSSHQPLHWFIEFHAQMARGGFAVVVGNPPYLEVGKLGGAYRPLGLRTLPCRDIYSWVVERAFSLRAEGGRVGLIVPVSVASAESFAPLREVLECVSGDLWLSHFANRPGQLFSGAQNRLTILLHAPNKAARRVFSTRYHRWDAKGGERDALFDLLEYVELGDLAGSFRGLLPKVGTDAAAAVQRRLRSDHSVADLLMRNSHFRIYWVRVPGYFCQFHLNPPMARPENGGEARPRGELISISCPDDRTRRILHSVLNSSTYYQFYVAYSDGRHINPTDVTAFMFDMSALPPSIATQLCRLSERLEQATRENTSPWRKSGLLIDSLDSRPLKPLLDEIDVALAQHYDFTDNDLDFIINYDLKYRLGLNRSTETQ